MYGRKKDTGGHAFPPGFAATAHAGYREGSSGMTLRDWFAGQALAGMLNSKALAHLNHDVQAATAYEFADAMIKARTK